MHTPFRALPPRSVALLPGELARRAELNRGYMLSLSNANLLQNYYMEAGLWNPRQKVDDIHWGWEAPTCQLRGHFLGHWLSAAANLYAGTGDMEAKAKADAIVRELARCQQANGGEWVGSVPEKYLDWIAAGRQIWAPHYTLHKTLMGLYDMVALVGSEQALDVLTRWANWFLRWTGKFSRRQLDDILDVETGGMLEVWANLYGVTRRDDHLELRRRADQPARQHDHPRDPRRGTRMGSDGRVTLARDRAGLLAAGRHRARRLCDWWAKLRRDLDAATPACHAPGRQKPGALHRL